MIVNVKALVFKTPLEKKCPKSQGSIKIPVLTQKDNFSSISRKGNLQNVQTYLMPGPHPRLSSGGGGRTWLFLFLSCVLTRFNSVGQTILTGTGSGCPHVNRDQHLSAWGSQSNSLAGQTTGSNSECSRDRNEGSQGRSTLLQGEEKGQCTREGARTHLLAACAFTFISSFIHQSFVESSPWARPSLAAGERISPVKGCLRET